MTKPTKPPAKPAQKPTGILARPTPMPKPIKAAEPIKSGAYRFVDD